MVTEIVLLLGFLCFLCIRNDYIRRRFAFVAAMVFWGVARLLTELTFKVEATSGSITYDWGSVSACIAAACLFFCLLSMFIACVAPLPPTRLPRNEVGQQEETSGETSSQRTASERIRELVAEDDNTNPRAT